MKTLALVLLLGFPAFAQTFDVKVIGRQTSDTVYNYQVAGHASSTSASDSNCSGNAVATSDNTANVNVNCSGGGTTNTTFTAPQNVSYSVTGATLSLLLPDGRVAVVNCASKFAERFAGAAGNHRGCRVPIVDGIQAEFKGKNAKLKWPVSLDGKKFDSETYKILAILQASSTTQ